MRFSATGGNNFRQRQFAGVARLEQRETPKESGSGSAACFSACRTG